MPEVSPGVAASTIDNAQAVSSPTPVLPPGNAAIDPASDPMALLEKRAKGIRKVLITLLVFGIFTLVYLASSMLIPIVAGVLLTLLFKPVVRWCEGWGIRPTISAVLITVALIAALVGAAAAAGGQVIQYASDLPSAWTEIQARVASVTEAIGDVGQPEAEEDEPSDDDELITEADIAAQTKAAAGEKVPEGRALAVIPTGPTPEVPSPMKPTVVPPNPGVAVIGLPEAQPPAAAEDGEAESMFGIEFNAVVTQAMSVTFPVIMGLVIAVGLMFFLLASGDLFLKKIVQVLPKLKDKKEAVTAAYELEHDVSTYLLTVTLINAALALVMWPILYWLGMPDAWMWAVLAGLMNYVPYLGPIVYEVLLVVVALLHFKENWQAALLPPLAFAVVNTIEAYVVTPTIMGKRFELNPVVVFVWLLIWGWLWGVAGALLAVPMLVVFRIMAYHIPMLQPIGDFIAEEGSSRSHRADEMREAEPGAAAAGSTA